MREPLAVPCEVEAASFSGRVPPSTREAVAYVDLCGLALLNPRTLRASHRWRFTNLAGWHATSETTLSVRYIPRPNAGPRTITLLFPPGCAPEVQLDMERKVRMYAEGMIPRERLDDDPLPEGTVAIGRISGPGPVRLRAPDGSERPADSPGWRHFS